MPRRNLLLIFGALVLSFLCYQRLDRNPYGRYFAEVMDQVDRNYMEPVNEEQLFDTAVDGVVRQLDGYSSFIGRSRTTRFQETLGQRFGGIGIEVSLDPQTNQLTVLSPLVGTPAYTAGVRSGDKILAVDGTSTAGFSLDDAVKLLRGKPGDPVVLRVLHKGETAPSEYEISRAVIKIDSVLGDKREPDGSWNFLMAGQDRLGYVRITSFGDETPSELAAALAWLEERDCRGLVIDLRNNPGGLLDAATAACEPFLKKGDLIVSTKRRGVDDPCRASGRGKYQGLPLVVLVNHYSASASEIMAACLQDHQRAVVVGERTWGKGTVQNVIPIEGGKSILTLTTASYWRPSGKNIHRSEKSRPEDDWGVRPDAGCDVKMSDEEFAKCMEARRRRDVARAPSTAEAPADSAPEATDPQLKRAIACLQPKDSS
jgi:carboxyl-terminal processing protease